MKIKMDRTVRLLAVTLVVFISACAGQQTKTASSVVDYLYPKGTDVTIQPSIPILSIPLKVGIAFVPEKKMESRGVNPWTGRAMGISALTEANKTDLLDKVASHFKAYEFVSEIEVIPSAYLTAGGSFSNLEQIKTMYGVDVIALVSYDQVQFTDEDYLSLTYWTLIGAYIISGEKNDTSTMIDTVVYDIKSKKMLFRAPGTSNVKGRSTPINLTEELRADSMTSFNEATDKMIQNLDFQLSSFTDKIKNNPKKAQVIMREGYSGGGAFGVFEIVLLLALVLIAVIKLKSRVVIRSHEID